MEDNPKFNFSIGRIPEEKRVTLQEAENALLEQFEKADSEKKAEEIVHALAHLAHLYRMNGKIQKAFKTYTHLIELVNDKGRISTYLFTQGQLLEKMHDYSTAIIYYRISLNLLPENDHGTRYFIFNNSGYCYNIGKEYKRAEKFCRRAIEINPRRHNAYKNLGIALEGQNRKREAAEMYLEATRKEASDRRALDLLINLVDKHPELKREIPDLSEKIDECVKMANLAYKVNNPRNKRAL